MHIYGLTASLTPWANGPFAFVATPFQDFCGGQAMAWLYLITAGLFEIGWPVGLKLSQTLGRLVIGVIIAVACMTASGILLWLAQRTIPIGTAYAVWTGIGAAGTFIVGILFYGDSAGALRLVSVGLIVAGIIGLKLAHGPG
ncbi:Quaternary ammonium compound-resistance protein sugE (modular protein) [Candidatus Contendobacter odensis Run_B_J11]|uniref:Guanidinium exporter n=2 Tax=Candidatus Contendibacter odensensis TaxID=1400860 RepID=A0A7U7GCF2_9GAMM|nr:Quaternary ammonium compound-resistance protein sugE (modular protein) [Candidatus Contendobacter odensis Run_B_J11]